MKKQAQAWAMTLAVSFFVLGGDGRVPAALGADLSSGDWSSVRQEGLQAGIDGAGLQTTLERCAVHGLSAEDTRSLLAPAREAAREALPASAVLMKIEEGLAKNVPAEGIRSAAQARLQHLATARGLLPEAPHGDAPVHEGLLLATAQALESGVPADVLQRVLAQSKGYGQGRVVHVVEAGESLHLEGFEPAEVEALMLDFLERNLRRAEVRRAVRYATEKNRRGMEQQTVRQTLWGKGGADTGGAGPGYGLQRRYQGGTGPGGTSGPGPGGGAGRAAAAPGDAGAAGAGSAPGSAGPDGTRPGPGPGAPPGPGGGGPGTGDSGQKGP